MSYIDTYDVLKSEKTKVFCKQRDVVVLHHVPSVTNVSIGGRVPNLTGIGV